MFTYYFFVTKLIVFFNRPDSKPQSLILVCCSRNPVGGPCVGDPRQYKICNSKVRESHWTCGSVFHLLPVLLECSRIRASHGPQAVRFVCTLRKTSAFQHNSSSLNGEQTKWLGLSCTLFQPINVMHQEHGREGCNLIGSSDIKNFSEDLQTVPFSATCAV